jgi:hypothetical protein
MILSDESLLELASAPWPQFEWPMAVIDSDVILLQAAGLHPMTGPSVA